MKNLIILVVTVALAAAQTCFVGCHLCDIAGVTCFVCTDPNQRPLEGGKCEHIPNQISGCQIYSAEGQCVQCQRGFRRTQVQTSLGLSTKCEKDLTGCLSFDQSGLCKECGFGTRLQNGRCSGILNCNILNKGDSRLCDQCYPGFGLVSRSKCFINKDCQQVEKNSGVCQACRPNFFLSGYSCTNSSAKILGCAIFDSTGQCLYCMEGLKLSNQRACTLGFDDTSSRIIESYFGSRPIDPNCIYIDKQWNVCRKCQYRYYLKGSTCLAVSQTCNEYELETGNCLRCNYEYTMTLSGTCVIAQKSVPNCNREQNGTCKNCLYGYFLTNNTCKAVSNLCVGYNMDNGDCINCPKNYTLQAGRCIVQMPPELPLELKCVERHSITYKCIKCIQSYRATIDGDCIFSQSDPNCKEFVSNQCRACSFRYYLSDKFVCNQVDDKCNQFDPNNGRCLSCYSGYRLQGFRCLKSGVQTNSPAANQFFQSSENARGSSINIQSGSIQTQIKPSPASILSQDPYCAQSGLAGNCLKCSGGYYLSKNVCTRANQQCKTYNDSNGQCLTCYTGYQINGGDCVVPVNNCLKYQNGKCSICQPEFYLILNQCRIKPKYCLVVDSQTGFCLQCDAKFTISFDSKFCVDINCGTIREKQCVQCRSPFLLFGDSCILTSSQVALQNSQFGPGDPNCLVSKQSVCFRCLNNFNLIDGKCIGNCIPPMAMINGKCDFPIKLRQTIIQTRTSNSLPPNCARANNGICLECVSSQYWKNGSNCQKSNYSNCKDYDNNTGECISCFAAFYLESGNCLLFMPPPNCLNFSYIQNQCIICETGYYLANNKCFIGTRFCVKYKPNTGYCIECYSDYRATNGNCMLKNPSCRQYEQGGKCVKCSTGFVLSQGSCFQVQSVCQTTNQIGQCKTCHNGYVLKENTCVIKPPLPPLPPNCKSSNDVGQCLQCRDFYYLQNGNCLLVSDLCKTYVKQSGKCTSCYPGYQNVNGMCIIPCIKKLNNKCRQCAKQFTLINGTCEILN